MEFKVTVLRYMTKFTCLKKAEINLMVFKTFRSSMKTRLGISYLVIWAKDTLISLKIVQASANKMAVNSPALPYLILPFNRSSIDLLFATKWRPFQICHWYKTIQNLWITQNAGAGGRMRKASSVFRPFTWLNTETHIRHIYASLLHKSNQIKLNEGEKIHTEIIAQYLVLIR